MNIAASSQEEPRPRKRVKEEADPEQTIRSMAIELVVKHGNDLPIAAKALLRRLLRDAPKLYEQKLEEALGFWAETEIRMARGGLRDQIITAEAIRVASKPDRGQISLRAFAIGWFDWPVLPGVMMRDATRPQLRQGAAEYQRHAETYLNRGGWFSAIADALPNDKVTVSQTLSEAAVAERAAAFGVSQVRRAA